MRVVFLTILLFHAFGGPAEAKPQSKGKARIAEARKDYEATLRLATEQAGLQYPPRELFVRVFKLESILEIWARDAVGKPFRSLMDLPLFDPLARGRKGREGDNITPEGFYRIVDYNSESAGYLSLKLSYPNEADRIYAAPEDPGSLIFIHGGGYTTGCVTLSGPGICQLYLLAIDSKRRPINVHIFPHRFNRPPEELQGTALIEAQPHLKEFWAELQLAYDAFETSKRLPQITISKDGRYRVRPAQR